MSLTKVTEQDAYLYEHMTEPIVYLSSISELFQQVRLGCRDIILANDETSIAKQADTITQIRADFGENVAKLEENIVNDSEEMKQLYSQFTASRTDYIADLDTLVELAKANNDVEAQALMNGHMKESVTGEMEAITAMVNYKNESAADTAAANASTAATAKTTMLIGLGFSVFLSIVLGVFLSGMLSKPMKEMVDVAERIASDDLNVEVTYHAKDEIGQLAQAFSRMIDNLNGTMGNVRSSADQVAYGSRQVATSAQALSQGATEQASSVEELTSSLEQISVQTQQNAERATEASKIALMAKNDAVEGIDHMQVMLKAMDDINEASANISKIIKVIDDIAFQTNILALNAAVEAARAGQHGKGFAVVAEEVRTLAARSANAAKETTTLIEGSIKKAEGGTKVAGETADSLKKIAEGVTTAANLVEQLAVASNEQSAGIAQINKAISQVSDVIQTNSATSEESAAASEQLSGQANILKEIIARFKLKNQRQSARIEETSPESGPEEAPEAAKKQPVINLSGAPFGKYSY
jgi:methyl-accepting chemotaxis protein